MSPRTDLTMTSSSSIQEEGGGGGGRGGGTGHSFTMRERSADDLQEAKQRATIKWLLAKAYNHRTPEELVEPFYRDHEGFEHLKPHVVHSLANAELYCLALSYLYSDPNYHNLNHWGVIQVLARKGIFVAEPADCSLTETVLIQTTPLKMSAHMAVTEALMALFLKESVSNERVLATIRRLDKNKSFNTEDVTRLEPEEALMLWIKEAAIALKKSVQEGGSENSTSVGLPEKTGIPGLSGGVHLSALIALYCPQDLPSSEIVFGQPPSMEGSLYNLQLVQNFCASILPFNVCHLTIEDLVYLHESIEPNVVCFLSDLFSVLELEPFKDKMELPGYEKSKTFQVPDPACLRQTHRGLPPSFCRAPIIPYLRQSIDSTEGSGKGSDLRKLKSPDGARQQGEKDKVPAVYERISHESSVESSPGDTFIVQKGRAVPTLSSVETSAKEQRNRDSKNEERGEAAPFEEPSDSLGRVSVFDKMRNIPVAGRPSSSEAAATRRKSLRRSSVGGESNHQSQLSVENMGGSQDNLHLLGRNPDKEMKTHSGRGRGRAGTAPKRELSPSSSPADSPQHRRVGSTSPSPAPATARGDEKEKEKVSFADLRKQKARDQFHTSGINITYNKDEHLVEQEQLGRNNAASEKIVSPPPNRDPQIANEANGVSPDAISSQLNNVRLKLEQRRRRIEEEKKKMESIMARQREKVGQEAFLRAVGARTASTSATNSTPTNTRLTEETGQPAQGACREQKEKSCKAQTKRPFSLKDVSADLSAMESRWLAGKPASASASSSGAVGAVHPAARTPDVESMDMDVYSRNMHQMNDSLHDLQTDIQRLAQQQLQIQQMMSQQQQQQQQMRPMAMPAMPHHQPNPMDPQPFYIAPDGPQPGAVAGGGPMVQPRRTWGQPQPIHFDAAPPPSEPWQPQLNHSPSRRLQWGAPAAQKQPQHSLYSGYQDLHQQQQQQHGYSPYAMSSTPDPHPQPRGLPQTQAGYMSSPSPGGYPTASGGSSFRLHDSRTRPGAAASPSPFVSHGQGGGPLTPSSPMRNSFGVSSGSVQQQQQQQQQQQHAVLDPPPVALAAQPSFSGTSVSALTAPSPSSGVVAPSTSGRPHLSSSSPYASPSPPPSLSASGSRRLHSSIPAPQEDDMAPQNVSFIETDPEELDEKRDADDKTAASLRRLPERLSQLNISSGSKTYRVHSSASEKESSPSPTRTARPTLSSTFKQSRRSSGGEPASGPSSLRSNSGVTQLTEEEAETLANMKTERLKDDTDASKGFVISFDDDPPKKPKPALKVRRLSKKYSAGDMNVDGTSSRKENVPPEVMICIDMNMGSDDGSLRAGHPSSSSPTSGARSATSPSRGNRKFVSSTAIRMSPTRSPSSAGVDWRSYDHSQPTNDPESDPIPKFDIDPSVPLEEMALIGGGGPTSEDSESAAEGSAGGNGSNSKTAGLIIGDELLNADPATQDEMQRKKERIMLQSLRRKQAAEDARLRKEDDARMRREEESKREEERARRKEEEKAKRDAILEQHRLKKEMEKLAEEQGRMPEPVSARPVPKLRSSSTAGRPSARPRPKTIHVDQDGGDMVAAIGASRGNRGSSSNISGLPRSDSRNSLHQLGRYDSNSNGVGRNSGLSLAAMGSRQRAAANAAGNNSRPGSRPASRRGSNAFLNEDNYSATLPPSGLRGGGGGGGPSIDWVAKQAQAARRKQSQTSVDGGDTIRMSRFDRNTRSMSQPRGKRDSSASSAYGGRDLRGSRESLNSGLTYTRRSAGGGGSNAYGDESDYYYGGSMRDLSNRHQGRRKSSSASYLDLCFFGGGVRPTAAGLSSSATGATPKLGSLRSLAVSGVYPTPRGRPSGMTMAKSRSIANLSGPGSLPGYRRGPRGGGGGGGGGNGEFDDGASDISSTSGFSAYGYRAGTRLYREPASKSNRSIVLNAIEYVVFPGVVNRDTREAVLDVIDRCDCPHFLLLFRDQKCQFRGLYAYYPDTEEVYKIYGTGPKQVTDKMFDSFFKYNSGGKKFTKIHTKHLTVTIDAFTIHNSLWMGKKSSRLPDKKDMALVI